MMPVPTPHDLECKVESCPVILRTHAIIRSIKGITSEQEACLSQARDQPAKYNAPINVTTETGRLFFRRRTKQSLLSRNVFELSPRDLQHTPNR